MESTTYHLGCIAGTIYPDALIFGDPGRCELTSTIIDESKQISSHRGFLVYNGRSGSTGFTFASLGIGGPSWAIGLHELAMCGAKTFIRVGTSGILNTTVKPGSLVIPTLAISDESISLYILGNRECLTPDGAVVSLLTHAAGTLSYPFHSGPVHSKDFLYMEEPQLYPTRDSIEHRMKDVRDLGCLVTEMECAVLFSFGLARGYRTGAILAAINEDRALSISTQEKALRIAIEAITSSRRETRA